MKLPKNKSTTIQSKKFKDFDTVKIDLETPETFQFYFSEFDNEKALMKYIKTVERLVRGSFEYKNYISYLKEEQNLTNCKFLNKIDIDEIKGVPIEFHHYPFNLYEIVETILKKQTDFYTHPTNTFELCNEVMRIHYENLVGLVPLSETVHELAHSGEIFINLNMVFGNVKHFMELYDSFISDGLKDSLKVLSDLSDKNALQSNKFILRKVFQEIILDGRECKPIISQDKDEKKLA